jgi:hypothetical protein
MTAQRRLMRSGATAATVVAIGLCLPAGSTGAGAPTAQAAKTINVTENADLHLVRRSGSTLYEEGTATGTLPGRVTARFKVTLTEVSGQVTIYPRGGGSLTINVVGYPRSTGVRARFAGSMAVRKGTGRFANAVGSGTFDGVVNRRTWDADVTAKARLTY